MSQLPVPWHLHAIAHQPGNPPAPASLAGRGVTVAVIDTGIDGSHPDLTGRIVAAYEIGQGGLVAVDPGSNHDSTATARAWPG